MRYILKDRNHYLLIMKRYNLKSKVSVVLLLPVLALTSCSNLSDASLTQIQGTGGGAAVGGAIGAGAGALLGGSTKATLWGAAIGAAVGGLFGHQYAKSIVKQKAAYATTEDYLNANIKQLSIRTNEVKSTNSNLTKQIANIRAQKSTLSADERVKTKKDLTDKANLAQQDIKVANAALSSATGEKRKALLNQIAQLKTERANLIRNTSTLMSVSSSKRGSV